MSILCKGVPYVTQKSLSKIIHSHLVEGDMVQGEETALKIDQTLAKMQQDTCDA